MELKLWDYDTTSSSDEMGAVTVDLEGGAQTFTLPDQSGGIFGGEGEITVKVEVWDAAPSAGYTWGAAHHGPPTDSYTPFCTSSCWSKDDFLQAHPECEVGYIKWSEAADLVAPDAPKMRLTHMKAAGILALACIGIIAVAVRRRHQPAAQAEEPTAPAML